MDDKIRKYVHAKERVKALKIFYLHLVLFLIGIPLILSLILLIDDSENRSFWIWLILTTIVTWCIGMAIHAWSVLGRNILFKKSWEDRKLKEYLEEEEEVTLWE